MRGDRLTPCSKLAKLTRAIKRNGPLATA